MNRTMENNENRRYGRGFAGMDPEKQREIASKGGKAAHEKGTAHEFDSEEAQRAGSKGGRAVHAHSGLSPSIRSEEIDEEDRFT
ncbi:KGG domain-containing protein [Patescibacteria group bacterium]|nr:KGG domain-containing protein [Patescibacteria group bacterium]